jgi:uncharacterized membrane protein YeiH
MIELVDSPLPFQLPPAFLMLAYFTGGITGVLAGLRRGYDITGVLALAFITAGGGGLIRDGLLISQGPASILTEPRALAVVGLAAVLTLISHRFVNRLARAIAVIDAVGLGAFAVYGVQRSMEAGLSLPAQILGGTITAVGGGLLRDILVREEPLLFKPGQFYALVAICGSMLFVGLLQVHLLTPDGAAWATIISVFVVRMLAIRFNWRTGALYREPSAPAE